MTTSTENQEPKFKRPDLSTMRFIENAQWKKGDQIITITVQDSNGEHKEAAYITLEGYDENKKPQFRTTDAQGKEILPLSGNLYQLKRDLKNKEIELTQGLQVQEPIQGIERQNITSAPKLEITGNNSNTNAEQNGSELKKVRTRKVKDQENEQTHTH